MKKLILFLLLGFMTSMLSAQVTAPDFTVVDTDGVSHHLYDYLDDGKIVVLDFFYVGCSYCQYYSSHIQQAYEDFGCNTGDVVFLGIDWNDTDSEVRAFDSTYGITYPSASGLEGGGDSVVSLYNITYYTTLLVIGPDKRILKDIKPPTTDNIDTFLLVLNARMMPCSVGFESNLSDSEMITGLLKNPLTSGEDIVLRTSSEDVSELVLTDYSGRLVFQQRIKPTDGIVRLPSSGLAPGLYMLQVRIAERAYTHKLVVL